MLDKTEVFKKVSEVLSKSMDIDESEIKMESLLFIEFKIESVEILEITFRMEKAFNFTMGESEFWNIATFIANSMAFDDGLPEEAIKLIKKYFSIDDSVLKTLSSPFEIYDHITVEDLVNFIINKQISLANQV